MRTRLFVITAYTAGLLLLACGAGAAYTPAGSIVLGLGLIFAAVVNGK